MFKAQTGLRQVANVMLRVASRVHGWTMLRLVPGRPRTAGDDMDSNGTWVVSSRELGSRSDWHGATFELVLGSDDNLGEACQ